MFCFDLCVLFGQSHHHPRRRRRRLYRTNPNRVALPSCLTLYENWVTLDERVQVAVEAVPVGAGPEFSQVKLSLHSPR